MLNNVFNLHIYVEYVGIKSAIRACIHVCIYRVAQN